MAHHNKRLIHRLYLSLSLYVLLGGVLYILYLQTFEHRTQTTPSSGCVGFNGTGLSTGLAGGLAMPIAMTMPSSLNLAAISSSSISSISGSGNSTQLAFGHSAVGAGAPIIPFSTTSSIMTANASANANANAAGFIRPADGMPHQLLSSGYHQHQHHHHQSLASFNPFQHSATSTAAVARPEDVFYNNLRSSLPTPVTCHYRPDDNPLAPMIPPPPQPSHGLSLAMNGAYRDR